MAYTQDTRFISIDTPLGKDLLLLQGFTGEEGISRPFRFDLDFLSEESAIDFENIVGQRVTIGVVLADGSKRHFNGFISRFSQSHKDERFTYYRAEMVPWLWFLTRRADCRIFQNKTIPEIVTSVFADLGFNDFKNLLEGNFQPREYCVQYRETDFNFVSRLMEEHGIFYFFEHGKEKHTLILANAATAHQCCPGQAKVLYEAVAGEVEEEDVVTSWQIEHELRPGKYALTDYNFETPSTSLAVNVRSIANVGGNDKHEVYDYPGEYLKRPEGQDLVKLRMEEEEVPHILVSGGSTCRAFTSGYRFDLTQHYRPDMNKSYVLAHVQHFGSVGDSYATGAATGASYSNRFTCFPYTVPYRPARITPKPIVQGPQTAVVVGKEGEEIWTDKYGRVRVQFHWDREGKWNENSSCWIRVAQTWAGKRWGAMFIPRIGQEVIVEFLEGDPDQPIITGRLYNAEEMPPYELPKEQTKSTIKSNSSKGGSGFNEIRFEDAKGKEQIFIHAERDHDFRVKNDCREWIGKDRHLIVKGSQIELVEAEKHAHVKGSQIESIGSDMSLQVGQNHDAKAGMKYAHEAGQEIHLKAGSKIIIDAGAQISLKGAGGFVDIGPGGVTIQGTIVSINSGGSAGAGSGSSPKDPKAPAGADTAKSGSVDTVPQRDPRAPWG